MIDRIISILILLLFLSLTLSNINLPGLHTDEAAHGVLASYILKPPNIPFPSSGYCIRWRGRFFPIMSNTLYNDGIHSYLLLPFFLIFGRNVFSLRLFPIIFVFIGIIFIYFLCKKWFGRKIAVLAVLLTVTDPIFVHSVRVGFSILEPFTICYFWIGLFFFDKYLKSKNPSFFAISFFFWGAGLSRRLIFLFYIAAAVITCAIMGKKLIKNINIRFRHLLLGFFSFCIGSLPIIYFNIIGVKPIIKSGYTIRHLTKNLFLPTEEGVNNLEYIRNLLIRILQFKDLILGRGLQWTSDQLFPNYLFSIIFFLGLVSVIILIFYKKQFTNLKTKILFLYLFYTTVFILTPFTISFHRYNHLLIMFPFPQIIVSLFLGLIWALYKKSKKIIAIIYLLVISLIICNISQSIYYHTQLREAGKKDYFWSSIIYELSDYLQKNKINKIFSLFHSLHYNTPFLTNNEVEVISVNYVFPPKGLEEIFRDYFLEKKTFFLVHPVGHLISEWSAFEKLCDDYKASIKLEKVFFEYQKNPIYNLHKITY